MFLWPSLKLLRFDQCLVCQITCKFIWGSHWSNRVNILDVLSIFILSLSYLFLLYCLIPYSIHPFIYLTFILLLIRMSEEPCLISGSHRCIHSCILFSTVTSQMPLWIPQVGYVKSVACCLPHITQWRSTSGWNSDELSCLITSINLYTVITF